VNTATRAET